MEPNTEIVPRKINPELLHVEQFENWARMEVTNDLEKTVCSQRLIDIAQRIEAIEIDRDSILKPLRQAAEATRSLANRPLDILLAVDGNLRRKWTAYMDSKRAEEEAAARKKRDDEIAEAKRLADDNARLATATGSEDAAKKAEIAQQHVAKLETKPLDLNQGQKLETGSVSARQVWDWEITDEAAIPRDYLVVNEKKLNEAKRKYEKTPVEILGVRFFQKTQPGVRA